MEKIFVVNSNNEKFEVYLNRYFNYDDTNYIIYTLFEKDEKGFIKLYLSKVMEELGKKVIIAITDEDEWQLMQKMIKIMIKEIKSNNISSFKDLNNNELSEIKLNSTKFFKLDENLTNILSGINAKSNDTKTEKIESKATIETYSNPNYEDINLIRIEIEKLINSFDYKLKNLVENKKKYGELPYFYYKNKNFEIKDLNNLELDDLLILKNNIENNIAEILIDIDNYILNYHVI